MRRSLLILLILTTLVLLAFSQRFDEPIQEVSDIEDLFDNGVIDEDVYNDLIYFFENKLDPNFATIQDLEALPAIEPLDAKNIVEFRDRIGGYANKEDLLKVPGIDRVKLEQFENFLTFEYMKKRKLPIKGEYKLKIDDTQDKPTSYSSTDQARIAIDDKPDIQQYVKLFLTDRYEVGIETRGDYIYDKIYFVNNRPEVFDKEYKFYISNRYMVLKNARSKIFNKVLIGDYRARYGQVRIGEALKVGTLSRVRNISKTRLRGNISSTSGERGVAILSRWSFNLTTVLFYSNKDESARYYNKDNPLFNKTRFILDSSEKLPGLVNSRKIGFNLNYSFPSAYIDLNLWNYNFRKYYDFELSDFPKVPNVWSISAFLGKTYSNAVIYASYVRKFHSNTDAAGLKGQLKMGDLRWDFTIKYKEADSDIDESVGMFSINSGFRQRLKYGKTKWYIDFEYDRERMTDINFLSQESLLDYAAKEVELDTTTTKAISTEEMLKTSEKFEASIEGRLTRYLTLRLRRKWSDDDVLRDKGNDISTYFSVRLKPFTKAYLYLDGKYSEAEIKYPAKYKEKLELAMTFRYYITKPLQIYFRYKLKDNDLNTSFDESAQYTFQIKYKYSRDFQWRIRYKINEYYDAKSEAYYFEISRKW